MNKAPQHFKGAGKSATKNQKGTADKRSAQIKVTYKKVTLPLNGRSLFCVVYVDIRINTIKFFVKINYDYPVMYFFKRG